MLTFSFYVFLTLRHFFSCLKFRSTLFKERYMTVFDWAVDYRRLNVLERSDNAI